MKKRSIKNLKLNKKTISDIPKNKKSVGGAEVSARRTNCDYCPPAKSDLCNPEPVPCYSENGAPSCLFPCTDPLYGCGVTWSEQNHS